MKKKNSDNNDEKGGKIEMVKLKCPRPKCGYEWEYNGNAGWYTSCPKCRTSVRVNQESSQTENNGKA